MIYLQIYFLLILSIILFKKILNDCLIFFFFSLICSSVIVWVFQAVNYLDIMIEDGRDYLVYLNFTLLNFPKILSKILKEVDHVYINTNEHYRQNVETQTREDRFIEKLKNFGGLSFKKSNPILQYQRSVKDEIELSLIKKACDITKKGFERVLSFVKPGVWEYEIEAEFSHEFLRNKSKRFAYTPIIASGINSNYLHYIKNNKQCQSGEIILMDVGAEYANYSSDMTRTIPVNGKFTTRQKTIYQAVLNVKKSATELLRPGVLWKDYHIEVGNIMTSELLKIGLLNKVDIQNQTKKKLPKMKLKKF